jgi:hypothetical protein
MISDFLMKRVSVTYKCYEMYVHREKKVSLSYHFSPFENENSEKII